MRLTLQGDEEEDSQVNVDDGVKRDERDHRDLLHTNVALAVVYPRNSAVALLAVVHLELFPDRVQDKVENGNNCVNAQHAKRVENVKLRLEPWLRRASNNVLRRLLANFPSFNLLSRNTGYALLSQPGTGRLTLSS